MSILFNRRFKTYEDLLEYEAIERGRVKGREEGTAMALQDVVRTFVTDYRDELPPDLDEKISQAKVDELKSWIKLLASGAKPQQIFAGT